MFKNYGEIENFLEYAEGIEYTSDVNSLKGAFIYSVLGYRKYIDTEFLEFLPNDLLAKMLFGVLITSEIDLSEYEYNIEESRKGNYTLVREQERYLEEEYQMKLKELNKSYNKF